MQPDDIAVDSANEVAVNMAMDALENDILGDTMGLLDFGVDYAADHADDTAFDPDDFDNGLDQMELGVEPDEEVLVDQDMDDWPLEENDTGFVDAFEVYDPNLDQGFERTDWD